MVTRKQLDGLVNVRCIMQDASGDTGTVIILYYHRDHARTKVSYRDASGHEGLIDIRDIVSLVSVEGDLRVYRGTTSGACEFQVSVITPRKRSHSLNLRLDVRNHSPTGFAWGYAGSGPAQLALAILCDVIGTERAQPLYQQFKAHRIATLKIDADWQMTEGEVLAWVAEQEGTSNRACRAE